MKTEVKTQPHQDKENLKSTRKTLKVLQHAASDKENLVGRVISDKDAKLAHTSTKQDFKRVKVEHKSCQTDSHTITADDLTSDEPSAEYWKKLAEKREGLLNESFTENERLRETVEALEEENKICKTMLDESRHLVEILQEMLEDSDGNAEDAQETTDDAPL